MDTLPVAFIEPDIYTAWFNWLMYDDVDANDADTAFNTYDAVCDKATYEAVCARVMNDAVTAFVAHDDVPNNELVTPFCTFKLPVIVVTNDESTTNMFVDPVDTVNNGPELLSVIDNKGPTDPLIVTTVDPDLYTDTLPVVFNEPDMFTVWFSWLTYDAVDENDALTAFVT